jgi:hypothetical protein
MTEYVVINGVTHAVNTESEIKAATSALTAAGVNSADVWRSPRTLEDLLENGDPDAVKTGQVVLADGDVDPVENGTAPSLATVLELAGVKALAIFIGFRAKSPENDWPHFEWLVELTRDDVRYRVPFKQGIGNIKPMPKTFRQDRSDSVRANLWLHEVKARIVPSAAEVVATLIASSSGSDQTFHDWCGDLGYSEDSRKALETYLACQVELVNLRRLLGRHLSAAIEAARDE